MTAASLSVLLSQTIASSARLSLPVTLRRADRSIAASWWRVGWSLVGSVVAVMGWCLRARGACAGWRAFRLVAATYRSELPANQRLGLLITRFVRLDAIVAIPRFARRVRICADIYGFVRNMPR